MIPAAEPVGRIPGCSFPPLMIMMAVRSVCQAATSFRAASKSIDLFYELSFGTPLQAPSHVTIQNFVLRLGLFEVQRPIEYADDWIWIIDHTHPQTLRSGDIAHHVATLFRRSLNKCPQWNAFTAACRQAKAKLQQTSLAHLIPPSLKSKARYMNLDELTAWASKVLDLLQRARENRLSPAQRCDFSPELLEEKLGWVENYAADIEDWSARWEMGRQVRETIRTQGYGDGMEELLDNQLKRGLGRGGSFGALRFKLRTRVDQV